MRHHVYLSPGMFGFGRLGSYNYFAHVQRELTARFLAAGHDLTCHVIEDLPTASIRRRATRLAELISQTSEDAPIHLLGHSTGGLDARLAASPATRSIPAASLEWLPLLRSVTTMNTPHFGTPLASFFATSNGQRLLAALSVLTFAGLSLGAQPLAATSVILGFLRGSDRLPLKIKLLDRSVESVVGLVDDARSPEVREFLSAIEDDQGSMLQLSPESMDLVVAGFEDRPNVVYQSTASMAPSPKPRRWIETVGHPSRTVSLSLFFGLHRITAVHDERYPCAAMRDAAPWAGEANEAFLARVLSVPPALDANDGIVPIRSQLWGTLVWAGLGDHLDVLGHYRDDRDPKSLPPEHRHRDWLTSGSNFGNAEFAALMDSIANGMLDAEVRPQLDAAQNGAAKGNAVPKSLV
jgi:pimeloyl-ACP methyl ester carboxylesterase